MLRLANQWEMRSVEERLVLMAISRELAEVNGLDVRYTDIRSMTGLSDTDFRQVVRQLKQDGLLEVEASIDGPSLRLVGDAVSTGLTPAHKYMEAEEADRQRKNMALRLAQKAKEREIPEWDSEGCW